MPTTPQKDAGCRIEPPVSEPSVNAASLAATHAALPPELPPGTRVISIGFFVILNAEFSVVEPMANSSIFNFPRITVSDFFNSSITHASYGGIYCSSIFEAQVVFIPFVHILSFTAHGMPASGFRFLPCNLL